MMSLSKKRQALGWTQADAAERFKRTRTDWQTLERSPNSQPAKQLEYALSLKILEGKADYSGDELRHMRQLLGWTEADAAKNFAIQPEMWQALENRPEGVGQPLIKYMQIELQESQRTRSTTTQPTPEHLRFFRKHFTLTQDEAARLVGVSRVTWNRWENKTSPIPNHMLVTLRGAAQQLKESKEEKR